MRPRSMADALARQILATLLEEDMAAFDGIRDLDVFEREQVLTVISNTITIYLQANHIPV
jgi:hypothetical protein